jgi:purine nucleoside phosphorylase
MTTQPTIAILTDTPQPGEVYETAYGVSAPIRRWERVGEPLLVCAPGTADPRATVRTLTDLGVTHLWLCESVGALSPLLETGDWLVPDDYIDGTRGQQYTYFSEKAGGYVQQVPPFDPAGQGALLAGAAAHTARPFRRGVYACVSSTRLETPAEARFWERAGAHVAGRFLSPCLTLARELEIRVAALVVVNRAGGEAGDPLPFVAYEPALRVALAQLAV